MWINPYMNSENKWVKATIKHEDKMAHHDDLIDEFNFIYYPKLSSVTQV